MRTVVITGSARGFGYAMLEDFYQTDAFNVVMIDVNQEALDAAKAKLEAQGKKGRVLAYVGDVTKLESLESIIESVAKELGAIDIWINNAGVNQLMKPIWEVDERTISRLIDIDLKGTIYGSRAIMAFYEKQQHGQIYNVEGFGSNDAYQVGLSIYGTAKRAVTYFTEALSNEVAKRGLNVQVGKITPGIMITNFINTSLGDGEKFELDEKTKKVYNILGDYPETIAEFIVAKIIPNKKNGVKFAWLTTRRAMGRFLRAKHYMARDFFHEQGK